MQVQQQKQSWHDHYKNVKAASSDDPVGEDDLVWALECVRSRAFSGPYSGKFQATGMTAQTLVITLVSRPYRGAQDRLLWRDENFPART